MKKNMRSSWLILPSTLLLGTVLSGGTLLAQSSQQQQEPSQQQQQPPDQTAPQPGSHAQQDQAQQDQVFVGTIVKSGDKYVLQDAGGKAWDIDRQDIVKKFEGKQVRVTGTLGEDGKTIHMK
jgi:hypothetical protein